MKLFRHGPVGKERPGVRVEGKGDLDVGAFGEDFDEEFFASRGTERLSAWMEAHPESCLPLAQPIRYGPPVKKPSKIVCVGLNYRDHAKESKMVLPPEPMLFMKSTTAVCGPNDDIIIPRNSHKTDWEVELAFVVGSKSSYVEEEDAVNHIAGYLLHNDYSEREFQIERSGQFVKGKSCDTFAPLGPWLVTPDEISDPQNLHLWLRVNGKIRQDSNTSNMVYKIPFLLSYISRFMTLLPGDIVSTGTPTGVGMGIQPEPIYLKPGDRVELGIDGLGSASQRLVSWSPESKYQEASKH
jgi:2,4-diketo-3-deoxy-L-fuconate hydrolase